MRNPFRRLKLRRLYCMIVKQEGTPESIARGIGLGVFVGFAFPLGTHLILGLPVAFLMRANKFLMILFTMPVNPYTITFLYPFQCWLGSVLLGHPMKIKVIKADFAHLFSAPSWESLRSLGSDVFWPLLLGGLVVGLLLGVFSYFAGLGMMQRYKLRKDAALRKRLSVSSKREKTVCINLADLK